MSEQKESSPALGWLYLAYTQLPLGGKKVPCPYWMNRLKQGIWGPFGGKGTPAQIVQATQQAADGQGVDLSLLETQEILAFMKKNRIGIDCSGFAFWMLEALDREKGGNGIADDIPGSRGRFLRARASIRMLTDTGVSRRLDSLAEVKVGDLIRTGGGRHGLIITTVVKDGGKLKELVYAHSERSGCRGVCQGKITRLDQVKGWRPEKGDGIYRLRIWG